MKSHSGQKAIVLTADQFRDEELFEPIAELKQHGWQVVVAAPEITTLTGELGGKIRPDTTIDNVNPDDYDLLVIPGGRPFGAPATVRDNVNAQHITQDFVKQKKPIASICHGPWLLASAKVVKGKHVTSFWYDGVPEDIRKAGGIWEDKEVVVDGNLVTARYPEDIPAFMQAVLKVTKTL